MGIYNTSVDVECDRCGKFEDIMPWEAATGHLATFCVDVDDLPHGWTAEGEETFCQDCQGDQ